MRSFSAGRICEKRDFGNFRSFEEKSDKQAEIHVEPEHGDAGPGRNRLADDRPLIIWSSPIFRIFSGDAIPFRPIFCFAMPIYAYHCATCGHAEDVLQKLNDAPLTQCPACGGAGFSKQVTAAGFQFKGSGWYETDFKNGPACPAASGRKAAGQEPAACPGCPAAQP